MESDNTASAKRTAAKGANITFSSVSIMVLLAFMIGTMFGKAAHQMMITMFNPDVVVLPNSNQ